MDRRGFLKVAGASVAGLALAAEPYAGTARPGRITRGTFRSARTGGREVGWTVFRPYGVTGTLPVVIGLHGRGNNQDRWPRRIHLAEYVSDHAARGGTPFAVAVVDGFNDYWHPRRVGRDMGGMVTDEFRPLLAEQGDLAVERLGFLGFSMGGYGSLRLASVLGPEQVFGVFAMAPAVFRTWADVRGGAFDDEADFAAYGMFGRQALLRDIPVRIVCGDDDPFRDQVAAFREGMDPRPGGGFAPGVHDARFQMRQLPAGLDFLGRHA